MWKIISRMQQDQVTMVHIFHLNQFMFLSNKHLKSASSQNIFDVLYSSRNGNMLQQFVISTSVEKCERNMYKTKFIHVCSICSSIYSIFCFKWVKYLEAHIYGEISWLQNLKDMALLYIYIYYIWSILICLA